MTFPQNQVILTHDYKDETFFTFWVEICSTTVILPHP